MRQKNENWAIVTASSRTTPMECHTRPYHSLVSIFYGLLLLLLLLVAVNSSVITAEWSPSQEKKLQSLQQCCARPTSWFINSSVAFILYFFFTVFALFAESNAIECINLMKQIDKSYTLICFSKSNTCDSSESVMLQPLVW